MEGKRRGGDVCVCVYERWWGGLQTKEESLCRGGGAKMVDVKAETADALANGVKWKEEKLAFCLKYRPVWENR